MKRLKLTPLQLTAHLAAWIPLGWLILDLLLQNLGPEPIREATLRTGKAALIFLVASLACTPVNILFRHKPALKLRRPLGLYSFMYASIHFAIFVAVDYGFNFSLLWSALFEKRYALIGLTTGLILLVLAITSTLGWQRRLKKNWKRLHKTVYIAGVLAAIHFIWLVKQGVLEPWIWAGAIGVLLLFRINPIKQRLLKFSR